MGGPLQRGDIRVGLGLVLGLRREIGRGTSNKVCSFQVPRGKAVVRRSLVIIIRRPLRPRNRQTAVSR